MKIARMSLNPFRVKNAFPLAILAFAAGTYNERNDTTWGAIQDASTDMKGAGLYIAKTANEIAAPVFSDVSRVAQSGDTEGALTQTGQVLGQCRHGDQACKRAFQTHFPGTHKVATQWSDSVLRGFQILTQPIREDRQVQVASR